MNLTIFQNGLRNIPIFLKTTPCIFLKNSNYYTFIFFLNMSYNIYISRFFFICLQCINCVYNQECFKKLRNPEFMRKICSERSATRPLFFNYNKLNKQDYRQTTNYFQYDLLSLVPSTNSP